LIHINSTTHENPNQQHRGQSYTSLQGQFFGVTAAAPHECHILQERFGEFGDSPSRTDTGTVLQNGQFFKRVEIDLLNSEGQFFRKNNDKKTKNVIHCVSFPHGNWLQANNVLLNKI